MAAVGANGVAAHKAIVLFVIRSGWRNDREAHAFECAKNTLWSGQRGRPKTLEKKLDRLTIVCSTHQCRRMGRLAVNVEQ
jgi:hypothetical protein